MTPANYAELNTVHTTKADQRVDQQTPGPCYDKKIQIETRSGKQSLATTCLLSPLRACAVCACLCAYGTVRRTYVRRTSQSLVGWFGWFGRLVAHGVGFEKRH